MSRDEPLVAGTLLGFRRFRVDEHGRLLPLHVGDRAWSDATTAAVCAHDPRHRAPVEGCSCGLHAWHHAEDALSRSDGVSVAAAVRAHGRIVLGEHGFRAERAEVVAVHLPARWTSRRRAAVAALLRAAYPHLEVLTSAREFRSRFPAESLHALGVRARPTRHARLSGAVHLPWMVGVVGLYSLMAWPAEWTGAVGAGGWPLLLAAFVVWQAWLVRGAIDDDC